MRIDIELSNKSINDAIRQIEQYQKKIKERMKIFVDRLLDVGIRVAEAQPNREYRGKILFDKDINEGISGISGKGILSVETDGDTIEGVFIAKDKETVTRTWKYKGGVKSVEVSPLLMSEFGSGWLAVVLDNVAGVGQGTFPGQIHATDPDGWYWTDENGRHHSIGEAPTFPVHSAMLAMLQEADGIARAVFSGL